MIKYDEAGLRAAREEVQRDVLARGVIGATGAAQERAGTSETTSGPTGTLNGRPRGDRTDEVETAPDLSSTLYVIRAGRASDFARVTKDWVETNRTTPLARALGPRYGDEQSRRVWTMLTCGASLRVACVPDDADAILGWCVADLHAQPTPVLHYVHVQRDMRAIGIARALVGNAPPVMRYSHQLSEAAFYRRAMGKGEAQSLVPRGWTFDPYAFFDHEPRSE